MGWNRRLAPSEVPAGEPGRKLMHSGVSARMVLKRENPWFSHELTARTERR